MSWAARLIQLATGDPQQPLRDALLRLYQASAERVARLAAHAAQAPTPGSETHLDELAAAETGVRDALQRALHARGVETPAAPAAANDGRHNHWARLVADLDACRAARDRLLRQRADLLERDPSIAELVDSVLANFDTQADGLRTLISRADPQALN